MGGPGPPDDRDGWPGPGVLQGRRTELSSPPALRLNLPLRLEDLLLAGWTAVANPVLFKLEGGKGPFDPNQPVEGLIRLGSVALVMVCLAARQPAGAAGAPRSTLTSGGALGPFVGGILLITISGFVAINASSHAVLAVLVVIAVALVAVRFAVPPLSAFARRLLVSPYLMVAAGLYWTLIESVIGPPVAASVRHQVLQDFRGSELVLFFLVAFSAVYYAMLIFAPRQVAEREGGVVEWLIRYLAFAASIALGIGWLGLLGT